MNRDNRAQNREQVRAQAEAVAGNIPGQGGAAGNGNVPAGQGAGLGQGLGRPPIQLPDQQFQELLNRLLPQGGQNPAAQPVTARLSPFTSGEGAEWVSWKRTFITICEMSGWNEERKRQELACAVQGAAQEQVADIDYRVGTLQELLGRYEARFIPVAMSSAAKGEFRIAKQRSDETILTWHSRLRALYLRSYPDRDPETDSDLIDKYIQGLADRAVAFHVYDQRPDTYAKALQLVQSRTATVALFGQESGHGKGIHEIEGPSYGVNYVPRFQGNTRPFVNRGSFRNRGQLNFRGNSN